MPAKQLVECKRKGQGEVRARLDRIENVKIQMKFLRRDDASLHRVESGASTSLGEWGSQAHQSLETLAHGDKERRERVALALRAVPVPQQHPQQLEHAARRVKVGCNGVGGVGSASVSDGRESTVGELEPELGEGWKHLSRHPLEHFTRGAQSLRSERFADTVQQHNRTTALSRRLREGDGANIELRVSLQIERVLCIVRVSGVELRKAH
jgi:hypothetical protein